jgi:hypothetical protein
MDEIPKMQSRLKIQLPIILPTATSAWRRTAATIDTANSGKEVPTATTRRYESLLLPHLIKNSLQPIFVFGFDNTIRRLQRFKFFAYRHPDGAHTTLCT